MEDFNNSLFIDREFVQMNLDYSLNNIYKL